MAEAYLNEFDGWLQSLVHEAYDVEKVRTISAAVSANSSDEESRCRLLVALSFFDMGAITKVDWCHKLGVAQVLWFIQNKPEHPILAIPLSYGFLYGNQESVDAVKGAWEKILLGNTCNAQALLNAASFFDFLDKTTCIELLQRAFDIEPRNRDVIDFARSVIFRFGLNPYLHIDLQERARQLEEAICCKDD